MFTVNFPVVDLRREPSLPDFSSKEIDRKQESQLLYGEVVQADGPAQNGWIKVRAIEQARFQPETGWAGYPGWVRQEHLIQGEAKPSLVVTAPWILLNSTEVPLGAYLECAGEMDNHWLVKPPIGPVCPVSKLNVAKIDPFTEDKRISVIATAKKLLGNKYTWGGRCPYLSTWKTTFTSVDCSGLTNLAYRVNGLQIPRDAHDQFLKGKEVQPAELKTADFIFLAPITSIPARMSHVMLFMVGDQFIDSNSNDGVIVSSGKKRFGTPISEMKNGAKVCSFSIQTQSYIEYQIYFRRIVNHA